ncbi:MAG: HlyD family efflux transporter periplasmic adaptor subunit [Pseudomonadota bacterium]|uniref:efflux RND transporter periplasmic adaptor subunit n=1 Tax=Gallaecimonas pentaromativorans TaxID=584787 RepID=UPI00067F5913|nr:HlyD family efflux transporter periplasmic adaptor subunit [Gallaecimonas pentaromativorans]MED5525274.1 HlyD family efflux transporter periplasmic adaptor subunit [Pseudomonadota bacterium]
MIRDTSGQDVILDNRRPYRKWAGLGAVALLVVALGWVVTSWRASASADAVVSKAALQLGTAEVADIARDINVQGRVVAANSPTLYSPAQGIVTYLIKAGDSVAKDQVIATVDSPSLTNQLKQEEANLARIQGESERQQIQAKRDALENRQAADLAKVDLEAADREMRRAELSWQKKVISQIDYEKAKDELARAKLRAHQSAENARLAVEMASFETKNLKLQVEHQALLVADLQRQSDELNVRSPVEGLVGNLALNQKSAVGAHEALLTVVDLHSFEVEVLVPESYADDLGLKMPVAVKVNGREWQGEVAAISPEIQNSQVVARLRFKGDTPDKLRQNQRLTARILLENRNQVLAVPRGAFIDVDQGRSAFVLRGDKAVRVPITLGAIGSRQAEVVDGLKAGDTIITSDTSRFKNQNTLLITQ